MGGSCNSDSRCIIRVKFGYFSVSHVISSFLDRIDKMPPAARPDLTMLGSLTDQLAAMVRDDFMAEEGYRRELHRRANVRDEVNRIRETILAQRMKKEISDTIEVSKEEIELAKTAVNNAESYLEKLEESLNQEITSAEARVASAQVSLDNANQSLLDVETDAENDLNQAYEDVLNVLNDAYTKAGDALHAQIDDMFDNDDSNNPNLTNFIMIFSYCFIHGN